MTKINKLCKEIEKAIEELMNKSVDMFDKLFAFPAQKRPSVASLFLLYKNISSSKIIFDLIEKGHIEEALALMRLFLERSALAFKISHNNIKLEDVKSVKPTKCISELKKHFPEAGSWYGKLSEVLHTNWGLFLGFHVKIIDKDRAKVQFQLNIEDPISIASTKMWLFFLSEINFAIFEFLAKDNISEISSWKYSNDKGWIYSTDIKLCEKIIIWGLEIKNKNKDN